MCIINPLKASVPTLIGLYLLPLIGTCIFIFTSACYSDLDDHLIHQSTTCAFVNKTYEDYCNCIKVQASCTSCNNLINCDYLRYQNLPGPCCSSSSSYCCLRYCDDSPSCCEILYGYFGHVICDTCTRYKPSVKFGCNSVNDTCCLIDYYKDDFKENSTFSCYYNANYCSYEISLSWNTPAWISVAVLCLGVLVILQIISFRIGYHFFPNVQQQKALTVYFFTWWILIFPLSLLLPFIVTKSNGVITKDVQWILLVVTCTTISLVLIIIIMINERQKRKRQYTIISALAFAFAVGIVPIVVGFWGEIVAYVSVGVIVALLLLGVAFGVISTRIQGVLRPMYKPAFETIRAHIITSDELAKLVNVGSSTLQKDMANFVDNPKLADIEFRVKNLEVIYAHRIILHVRVPNLLRHLEKTESPDEPQLDYPKKIVLHLLELIYAGETVLPKDLEEKNQLLEDLMYLDKSLELNLFKLAITDYMAGESRQENLASEDFIHLELTRIALPISDLTNCFNEAFDNPKYSDAIIICEKMEVPNIHKVFLAARSSFYDTLFSSSWTNRNNAGRYPINIPYEVFVVIQKYVYTDTITKDLSGDVVIGVLIEAEVLGLTKLRKLCERYIAARLTNENVQELYSFCEDYGASQLKLACEYYSTKKQMRLEVTPLISSREDDLLLL